MPSPPPEPVSLWPFSFRLTLLALMLMPHDKSALSTYVPGLEMSVSAQVLIGVSAHTGTAPAVRAISVPIKIVIRLCLDLLNTLLLFIFLCLPKRYLADNAFELYVSWDRALY